MLFRLWPTLGITMSRWNIRTPYVLEGQETTDHALFQCSCAREVWEILFPSGFRYFLGQMDVKDRWVRFSSDCEEELPLICMGAWAIWNDRNSSIHKRPFPDIGFRCSWIQEYLAEYAKANTPCGGENSHFQNDSLVFRAEEDVIMNVDVAYGTANCKIGIGVVIIDKQGALMVALSSPAYIGPNPLCIETMAMLEGLKLANELKVVSMRSLTDSLNLCCILNGDIPCEASIAPVKWDVDQIRGTLSFFHVPRNLNGMAHELAREGVFSSP